MPKPAPAPRSPFKTYRHLLAALRDGGMTMVGHIADVMGREGRGASSGMELSTTIRHFAVISGFVRRSIVVSRYIGSVPVPTEEREHRLGAALERVFRRFAARKITVEEYNRAIDAQIDGELDDELEEAMLDDDLDPDADVPGRSPAALVAELCRDFGMIAHSVPTAWLKPVPTELRMLCARAAASAIRPVGSPARVSPAVLR